MTKRLVFILSQPPHGTAAAREGLDAILAASAVTEDIAVIFEGEGIYQILEGQQPQAIEQRHIEPTFKMLDLYDVEDVYLDADSFSKSGISQECLCIDAELLAVDQKQQLLSSAHAIYRF